MADSNIDVRIVLTDNQVRDQLQVFLQNFDFDTALRDSFAEASAHLQRIGLDPEPILGARPSRVAITQVRPMGSMGLEFHVMGSVSAAPDFTGRLIQGVKSLGTSEIIYADLNDQVMEIAVYYQSDKGECSYETGFDGDADEALWEADSDGTLLDTIRELALSNQLTMPAFD